MSTRIRTGVVVTAHHPTLGPLYWELLSEASVGAPDFHSVSQNIERALLLEPDWREKDRGFYGDHLQRVLREQASVYRDREYWGVDVKIIFEGNLASLHEKSGQSEEDFLAWMQTVEWVDVPGPSRVEHLVDHGYFEEWEAASKTFN